MNNDSPDLSNNDAPRESNEKGKRPWKPNKERKVASKKSFDSKKISHLKERENSIYRGELDPRKPDPQAKKGPRTISRSEEKLRKKPAR